MFGRSDNSAVHSGKSTPGTDQNASPSMRSSRPTSVSSVESFKSTASQAQNASTSKVVSGPAPITHGPTRIPLTGLSATSKAPGPPKLNAQQEAMYEEVLAAVSQWKSVPESTAKGAKATPLLEHEKMFLTRECLLRYLRATKWKVPDALKRLQGTLSWRREYGADTFTGDYISPENETGKQVIMGWDKDGRTCLYLNPGRQNTKMSDRQIHHLSFMLDRTIDMLPPGQETNCLLINFKGATSGAVPSVAQAKAVLNILQNHNPERLGRALISDLPWYVSTFFKLISPLIDPVTREKMKFSPKLLDYVPAEQLIGEFGGKLDFQYDHQSYWPSLVAECARRREVYKERWQRGGCLLGEHEDYLRGGTDYGLSKISGQTDQGLSTQTEKLAI